MTCAHVLGLIDAGPFADYPRAHLDAAWQHARQCATCGPALEAATVLTENLFALPRPAPPPELSATIIARIARIEPARSTPAPSATRGWWAWAMVGGGLAAGWAIVLFPPTGAAPIAMPSTIVGVLALAAGLVLYVVGLFAPLGGNGRR